MALDSQNITNEPNNIFDHIRSSSKGIIDCVKNDFINFFPTNTEVDTRFINYRPFIGDHFGFYHSGSITDISVIDSFNRKIQRFYDHCNSNKNIIFMRTCIIPNYEEELDDMKELSLELLKKYPTLKFRIVFIIPDQDITTYYKHIDDKIFIFTANDKSYNNNNVGNEYKNIFDFIFKNNLFEQVPVSNEDIEIVRPTTRLCLVDNIPTVNYFEKYISE